MRTLVAVADSIVTVMRLTDSNSDEFVAVVDSESVTVLLRLTVQHCCSCASSCVTDTVVVVDEVSRLSARSLFASANRSHQRCANSSFNR